MIKIEEYHKKRKSCFYFELLKNYGYIDIILRKINIQLFYFQLFVFVNRKFLYFSITFIILSIKMTIGDTLKRLISMNDFFNSSSMLRFEKQNEYKTITGGLVSIAIVIVIFIGFTKQILITFEKTSIQVKSNINKLNVPTSSQITFSPQLSQMFAFYVRGMEYNTNIRHFDIRAFAYHYDLTQISHQVSQFTKINLVPCTKQHWKGFDQINFVYDLQSMLCPEIGTSAEIFGKYSSGKFKSIDLQVVACDPSISSIPCATKSQVQQFWEKMRGSTMFNFFYLNTIINPEYAGYKQYYFEERDYGFIGPTLGCDATLQLADYTVTTDESIWPFANESIDNGIFFPKQTSKKYFPRTYDSYSYFTLQIIKSSDKYIFQRSVQKISTIFSYIGGVISSILTAFFIMNNYTSFSFEISIANQLFKQSRVSKSQQIISSYTQESEVKSDINEKKGKKSQKEICLKMNIFLYIKYNIYPFFKNRLKNGPQWRDMQHINICHDQMTKQLDIKRIIKRIIFLEHCITRTIEADKIKDLIGSQPISPEQIKKNRIQLSQALQQDSSESDRSNIGQKVSGNNCQNDYDFSGEITAEQMMKKEGVKASIEEEQYDKNHQNLQVLPPTVFQTKQIHQIYKATETKSNKSNRLQKCMTVKDLTNIKPIDEQKLSQMSYDMNVIPIQYCPPINK